MSKRGKLIRSGIAAAVAVALGGLAYTNYAQTGSASTVAQADTGDGQADHPAARRARQQWLSAVTPPSGVAQPGPASIGAAVRDPHQLILQSGLFDPLDTRQNAPNAGVSVSQRYAIVQFAAGAQSPREALERSGATILGYVPNNAYLVRADNRGGIAGLQGLSGVRWAGGYRSDMKLAPGLLQHVASTDQAGPTRLVATLFDRENARRAAQAIQSRLPDARVGNIFNDAEAPALNLEVPGKMLAEALSALSQLDAVQQLSLYVGPQLDNTATIPVLQSNYTPGSTSEPGTGKVAGATPLWDQGIVGAGQIVGLLDSRIDRDEASFVYQRKTDSDTAAIAITPRSEIAASTDGAALALGSLHPGNKIIGFWVKPNEVDGAQDHGTHTAGTIAGDLSGKYGTSQYAASSESQANHDAADGIAPNAQLLGTSLEFLTYDDGAYPLQKLLDQAHAAGARIHSDSWSATYGTYAQLSRSADIATYRNDDLLVVKSAGNTGNADTTQSSGDRLVCGESDYRGGRCWNSMGDPAAAKNLLVVGALGHGSSKDVADYSARGTLDGRFRPDIMAPGSSVVSVAYQTSTDVNKALYKPKTATKTGTSMATPAISAAATLVRQYFTDGFYPSGARNAADGIVPSSALLKAVLLNATQPVKDSANASSYVNKGSTDWPIVGGGWGRPWLDGNLWFKSTKTGGDDKRRLRLFERGNGSGLKTGDSNEYEIAAVRAGEELRITLTWTDPPATTGAALALVNNLDLEVEGPDGRIYRGNQLTAGVSTEYCTKTRSETQTGCTVAGATHTDALNNVEQVRLTAPTAGKYILRIKGAAVPGAGESLAGSDRQGYALAVSGAFGPAAGKAQLAAPAELSATARAADATSASLSFGAVADATGYQLYRAEGGCPAVGAKAYRLVAAGTGTSLSDGLIAAGKTYGYAVRAIGSDVEGVLSGCVSSAPAPAPAAAPATPAAVATTETAAAANGG
ncbi:MULTISPECIES: S8 family serine peptidase [unclassified Lysobacter]|uniref:S8 family serine peptidase n=1 Tax=unclassified Lysobacter TaxID=2635362 RepID=UPI001BE5FA1C|nr:MULTISPECIES: S8 family serine peptidase [unclassified Lysobacter]MBT2745102.1 S8 family serine peptidase [Lysobacter sp. ISL-42]MBT2751038.1 S8 family serine peptidase [Lysobacter sp. ISL-50]MBT2779179.1 S8 family serine peptidase [Lysobacter sp. ISL-54]MBT2782771.1 S8 family serine peptidase [Lysobacter sp. ISL-52]